MNIFIINKKMGVPGFFAWLLRKYKKNNIITSSLNTQADILYLDSNCLFHPQCFKTLDVYDNWDSKEFI